MRSSGGVGVGESAMSVVCLQPPPAGGGTGRFRGQKKPEKQGSPPNRRGGGETVDYIGKSVGNRPRGGANFVAILASNFQWAAVASSGRVTGPAVDPAEQARA